MTLLGVGDAAPKPICGCCEGVLAAPPPNSDGAGEGELGIAVFAPKSDGVAEGVENAIAFFFLLLLLRFAKRSCVKCTTTIDAGSGRLEECSVSNRGLCVQQFVHCRLCEELGRKADDVRVEDCEDENGELEQWLEWM